MVEAYFDNFARDLETSPFAPQDGEDTDQWLERLTKRFDDPDATMEERLAIAAAVVSRYDPSFNPTRLSEGPDDGSRPLPERSSLIPDPNKKGATDRFLRAQHADPEQTFENLDDVDEPDEILQAFEEGGLDTLLAQALLLTPEGDLLRKGTLWRSDIKPDATRSVGERMQATLGMLYGVMIGGGHDGSWAPDVKPYFPSPKP